VRFVGLLALSLGLSRGASGDEVAARLPEGFRADLVLSAPEIEAPSVVTCDDQGNLFLGEDPMDMRGPATREFDRVLLLRWNDDGTLARKSVFCEGLAAVFGLVWHNGWLYVMHAPHYSRFRDADGDGVAETREDLAEGFGPPAGIHGFNDHIVSGMRMGLDGWMYVSVGDKGIQRARGADGSTITLEGGGVIRMRPDGTRLEVLTSGTRNHLDVAMDSWDNIFTYDNTDDGLGWWTRFTHHIPTGYYGYPYDYHPHRERHLPHMSEHGGGSPTGAACYCEGAWPQRYRDSAFHCEWGKGRIQRFAVTRQGGTFSAQIEDFMQVDGEFRPQDLCFSPDGRAMYVADWNYGGWVNPAVRGRLFRVTYTGDDLAESPKACGEQASPEELVAQLDHPGRSAREQAQHRLAKLGAPAAEATAKLLASDSSARAKVHALWTQYALIEQIPGYDPTELWCMALQDADPEVRAQAARALGMQPQPAVVEAVTEALGDVDARVRLQAAVALGRTNDPRAVRPLYEALAEKDEFVRFAITQAIRKLDHWNAAEAGLAAEQPELRQATLLALTGVYRPQAVEALKQALGNGNWPDTQKGALAALAEVYQRAKPYETGWWGTQPARNPFARPKDQPWEQSDAIGATLISAVDDDRSDVRLGAIEAVAQLDLPGGREALRKHAASDGDAEVRRRAIAALGKLRDEGSVDLLGKIALDEASTAELREAAVGALAAMQAQSAADQLLALLNRDDVRVELAQLCLATLGTLKPAGAETAVQRFLTHGNGGLRATAVEALAQIAGQPCAVRLTELLEDNEVAVRQKVLAALGRLRDPATLPAILNAAQGADVQFEAIAALATMPDARGVRAYLEGLQSKNAELRSACRTALGTVRDAAAEQILALADRRELSGELCRELQVVFSSPVPVAHWHVTGTWPIEHAPQFDAVKSPVFDQPLTVGDKNFDWKSVETRDPEGRLSLLPHFEPNSSVWALAAVELEQAAEGPAQLLVGSDDEMVLWVNGQQVYEYRSARGWGPEQGKVDVTLQAGKNAVWCLIGNHSGPWEMSLRVQRLDERFAFLREAAAAPLTTESFREFAANNAGEAVRGQQIFSDPKGIGCIKCHAVAGQGGQVGPDLRGLATKYPREELIRSILEPSARVLSGYELTIVVTDDGRQLQGVVRRETPEELDLVDAEGKTHTIALESIEDRQLSKLSLMPSGLKDGLSLADFADIVAYLQTLVEPTVSGGATAGGKP
jgi:putative membrane-bound dehydrogenase-like protein